MVVQVDDLLARLRARLSKLHSFKTPPSYFVIDEQNLSKFVETFAKVLLRDTFKI